MSTRPNVVWTRMDEAAYNLRRAYFEGTPEQRLVLLQAIEILKPLLTPDTIPAFKPTDEKP